MSKKRIYIAYKRKDEKRFKKIEEIHDLLVDEFGFEAWFDKRIKGGDRFILEMETWLRWANNFLLILHNDTHTGKKVKRELEVAFTRQDNEDYEKVVPLIIDKSVNPENTSLFLDPVTYIRTDKGHDWKIKLYNAFTRQDDALSSDMIQKLINTNEKDKFISLLKKCYSKACFQRVIENLKVVSKCFKEKSYKKRCSDWTVIAINESLYKEHKKKRKPPPDIRSKWNGLIRRIKSSHGNPYSNGCKIIVGLLHLFKFINLNEPNLNSKFSLLGITEDMKAVIVKALIDEKIITQIENTLILNDGNLGQNVIQDAFLVKNAIVPYKRIEEIFHG